MMLKDRPRLLYVAFAALFVYLFSASLWLWQLGPLGSYDSSTYIDGARSYAAGRGFLTRPYSDFSGAVWVKQRTHPPGYSLLILGAMSLGISAVSAATLVPFLSGAIIVVFVAAFLFYLRFPPWMSLVVLLAMVSMPAYVKICVSHWSEAPYIAFSLGALLCATRWTLGFRKTLLWIFGAGLLTGIACTIRNSAIAAVTALTVFIILHLAWRSFPDVLRSLILYFLGFMCSAGWLLMKNLHDFGVLLPYEMPPGDVSVLTNLLRITNVVFMDLTALRPMIKVFLHQTYGIFVSLCGVAVVVCVVFTSMCEILHVLVKSDHSLNELRETARSHRVFLLLVIYAIFFLSLTVIAATLYKMDEIEYRFLVPVYGILLVCMACVALAKRHFRTAPGRMAATLFFWGMIVSCPLQMFAQAAYFYNYSEKSEARMDRTTFAKSMGEIIPQALFVLTDDVEALRIHAGLPAVVLRKETATKSAIQSAARKGKLWGIVIWDRNALRPEYHGRDVIEIVNSPEQHEGFEVLDGTEADRVVLRYAASYENE